MNILYQDDAIVVAVKPAGVLSQEDEKGRDNMPERLREILGGKIFSVHRLDRETQGVMVFARNEKAAASLSRQIAEGKWEKEYLAVATGCPQEKEGSLQDLLFFDRSKNKVFCVKRERKGVKKALLYYQVLEEKNGFSLISVLPKTGRTHQIRVQFASRRHPLYGDRKYSGNGEGLGLFCKRLSFTHPTTGDVLSFSALPEEKEPWSYFSNL
jgi:23S rRNA pseudouridine1911/1915/1917 synthase